MYGRNEYDFNLNNPYFEKSARIDDLVQEISDEVYQDIKKHGVMMSLCRVYTKFPMYSSAQATVLEEMVEWCNEHRQFETAELFDAMFTESKREQMLIKFCNDYAERSVNKDFD
jgi:hypothetical protein